MADHRVQWYNTIMRRMFERSTKGRFSFSGGPHDPVNIADSMENGGSWTVTGSTKAMEVPNFKDLLQKTWHTKYSAVKHMKRSIPSLLFSTRIRFFHSLRYVYRSVWPVREAKPRFGAALVRSTHD